MVLRVTDGISKEARRPGTDFHIVIDANTAPAAPIGAQPVLPIQQFGGEENFHVFGEFQDGELLRVQVQFVGPEA
ncbi:MAG: hypothetical protein ACXWH0_17035 [Acidimicrobiia bacterium]